MANYKNIYEKNNLFIKKQKITATITAAAIALGAIAGVSAVKAKKIAINNMPKEDTHLVDEDALKQGLYITENFDINDVNAVKARAQGIYDISEKNVSVEKIMNLIYLINEKYNLMKFQSSDQEKIMDELRELVRKDYTSLTDDNITSYVQKMNGLLNDVEDVPTTNQKNVEFIYTYMFMANSSEEKDLSIKFADLVEEQKKDIESKTTSDFVSNYDEYYKLSKKLHDDLFKYNDQRGYALVNDIGPGPKSLLYVGIDKEQDKLFSDNWQNSKNNSVFAAAAEVVCLDAYQKAIDKGEKEGYGEITTNKSGKSYNDKDVAEKNQTTKIYSYNEKTSKGHEVGTVKGEATGEVTTHIVTTTGVATTKTPTGTSTTVKKGGEQVGETTTKKEVDPNVTTKHTTTKPSITINDDDEEVVMTPEEYEKASKSALMVANASDGTDNLEYSKSLDTLATTAGAGSIGFAVAALARVMKDRSEKRKQAFELITGESYGDEPKKYKDAENKKSKRK